MRCSLFLRKSIYLIPILALLLTFFGPLLSVHGAPKVAVIKAESWVQSASELHDSGSVRHDTKNGTTTITYESIPHEVGFEFNAVATKWDGSWANDAAVQLSISTSSSSKGWSDWVDIQPDENDDQIPNQTFGQLVVINGHYIRYRLQVSYPVNEAEPNVSNVHFTFINSNQGPSAKDLAMSDSGVAHAATPKPRIISRSEWGADESLRFDDQGREIWPHKYATPRKVIIHDTQTANNDPNPPATIRAIYYYHAVIRGWGDIGYNYLVDEQGNIYEGRAGGPTVVAGHARCFNWGTVGIAALGNHDSVRPSAAMLSSIENLTAWIFSKYHIDPFGHGVLGSYAPRDIPNIAGHRDLKGVCGNTHNDPGYYLYHLFPEIRRAVAQRMDGGNANDSLPASSSLRSSGSGDDPNKCSDKDPSPPGLTYKVVNTHNTGLNLHVCPDTASRILIAIPEGRVIHEIPSDVDGWVKTTYNGKTGYVWHKFLSVVKDSQQKSRPKSQPKPKAAKCGDDNPTPPGLDYKVVNTHNTGLNLHVCPNTDSKVLATVPEGKIVHETPSDIDGWVKTTYGGKTGYLWKGFLKVVKNETKNTANKSATKSGGATNNKCGTNGPPRKPEPTYVVHGTGGSGLYLRECPTTDSKHLDIVPEGHVVHEITSEVDGWVKTKYNGKTGYLWHTYLKVTKPASKSFTGSKRSDTSTTKLAPDTKAKVDGTPGALNLRKGPGMSYKPITKMWEGVTITITGAPRNGWYPVRYVNDFGKRYNGWAWGEYLSPTHPRAAQIVGAGTFAGALAIPLWRRKRRKRTRNRAY